MAKLNPKQKRFVELYCSNLNATESAKLAGYAPRTSRQQGARLLSHVVIKQEIAKRLSKATQRAEIQLDEVMAELRKLAFANMADFCTWTKKTVELTPSDELPRELLAAVEWVGETQDKAGNVLVKIRLCSKQQALNAILKLYELSEVEARLAAVEERLDK